MRPVITLFTCLSVLLSGCVHGVHRSTGPAQQFCPLSEKDIGTSTNADVDVVWSEHGALAYFPSCPDRLYGATLVDSSMPALVKMYQSMDLDQTSAIRVKASIKIERKLPLNNFSIRILSVMNFKKVVNGSHLTD